MMDDIVGKYIVLAVFLVYMFIHNHSLNIAQRKNRLTDVFFTLNLFLAPFVYIYIIVASKRKEGNEEVTLLNLLVAVVWFVFLLIALMAKF